MYNLSPHTIILASQALAFGRDCLF